MQSTVCSLQYAVYSMQSVVCSLQYAVYSMQSTVCSLQYAVCSMQSTVCSLQYAVYSMQSTVCSLQYAVCSMESTVCSLQYAVYSMQHMSGIHTYACTDACVLCNEYIHCAYFTCVDMFCNDITRSTHQSFEGSLYFCIAYYTALCHIKATKCTNYQKYINA